MELIPVLVSLSKEAGTPLTWAAVFVAMLFAAQRFFGGWFEMARAGAAGNAAAASQASATMLELINRLNAEIKRLSDAEARIMERLAECEQRHRTRDAEVEKLQAQVAALNVKLFSVGLGNDPS